jgi:hypothetical protein
MGKDILELLSSSMYVETIVGKQEKRSRRDSPSWIRSFPRAFFLPGLLTSWENGRKD